MNEHLRKLYKRIKTEHGEKTANALPWEELDRLLESKSQVISSLSHALSKGHGEIDKQVENKERQPEAPEQLKYYIAKQKALLDVSPEAIFSFRPGGKINQLNRAAETFLKINLAEMKKNNAQENFELLAKKLEDPHGFKLELERLSRDNSLTLRGYSTMTDGKIYEYNSVPEFMDDIYVGRAWCWRDVTEIKASQDLLKHQAYHDMLTNLPNRLLLLKTLEHAINIAKRNERKVALLFIDLDNFKKINDTEGHDIGDMFLVEAANLIQSKLKEGDTFGRLGGDEFIIILEGIQHQHEIGLVYQDLKSVFDAPLTINTKQFFISGSIGVSQFPIDGDNPDTLIRKADMAMYQAKKMGKNTIYYFDPALERFAVHRMSLETQLRQAFDQDEFFLVFQPKVSLNKNKIIGAEALLRWRQSDNSMRPPDHFITIAEQIGLIANITQFVLKETCKTLSKWKSSHLNNITVSVNISAFDLREESLFHSICNLLQRYQLNGHQLELELTEHAFLHEKDRATKIMKQLKDIGVKVAVDDFGTGYSSFSYLHDLDVDSLKIDRSFVTNIDQSPRAQAIIKSILSVGQNLDMHIIAEGVETLEELKKLEALGCDIIQGYYICTPLIDSEFFNYTKQCPSLQVPAHTKTINGE